MRSHLQHLPMAVVLLVVAAGLYGAGVLHAWRAGAAVVGLGFLLGGTLRLALPARGAGLLVVRSRGLDAGVLLVLGTAVVVLARAIPAIHG